MRISKFLLLAAAGLGSFIEPVRAADPQPGPAAPATVAIAPDSGTPAVTASTPALPALPAVTPDSSTPAGLTASAPALPALPAITPDGGTRAGLILNPPALPAVTPVGGTRVGGTPTRVTASAPAVAVTPVGGTSAGLTTNAPALIAVDTGGCSSTCCNGLTFGTGIYVMRASFDNNLAFGVQTTTGQTKVSPGTRTAQRIDIDHQCVVAPEFWLGWMSESGCGVRVRYWYFSDGTSQEVNGKNNGANSTLLFSAAPLGLGLMNGTSVMAATSQLQLHVWDFEGQYQFCAASWNVLLSGGLRVADIDQRYNAYSPAKGSSSLLSTNDFSGVGPTLALMLRHPLGSTSLNAYGSARYSFVFGDGHQEASIPDQKVSAQDERHVGMGIGELELGLEANHAVGRSRLFGQVGVNAQNWSGAGSASRSSVNVLPGGGFNGASYTGASDINFIGLALRVGVNY